MVIAFVSKQVKGGQKLHAWHMSPHKARIEFGMEVTHYRVTRVTW